MLKVGFIPVHDYLCEESVMIMEIKAVSTIQNQPKNRSTKAALAAAGGAAIGAASRYVLPNKTELSSMFNKEGFDTFVSSGAAAARGANRSILKFGAAGALLALGVQAISKFFKPENKETKEVEYTKLGALIDAPDYACAMAWYVVE